MSNKYTKLTEPLYQYLKKNSVREPPILKELRKETRAIPWSIMQISPDQGQFMALLVKLTGAKKCLEIGVFTGYSSLSVALALPEKGKLTACDVSEEWTGIARKYWKKAGVEKKITLHLAPAVKTLNKLLRTRGKNTYDFAFIDADKESYPAYYEKTLQLLNPGGLMLFDNVFLGGRVADSKDNHPVVKIMKKFNRDLKNDKRVEISMIPVADGLTLVRKI